jgi:hypothetical protein
MSEIGEMYAATKEQRAHESKHRKRKNMNGSMIMLGKNGINYESKNDGVHLVVSHKGRVADFWPTTGKFNIRGDKRYFRGVRLLIKIMRGDYSEEQFKALQEH